MHIAAAPERIYTAFVVPEVVVRWLPPDGMTGRIAVFDARPGGRLRLTLAYRDPSEHGKTAGAEDVVQGVFVELVPGIRVVQDVEFVSDNPLFSGTMRMTWAVAPAPGGSFVSIRAENVPDGIPAADHRTGITASLRNLAALAAGAEPF